MPLQVLLIEDNSGDVRMTQEVFRDSSSDFRFTKVKPPPHGQAARAPGWIQPVRG